MEDGRAAHRTGESSADGSRDGRGASYPGQVLRPLRRRHQHAGPLLRSGLNRNGRVGRRTFLHPVVSVIGEYDHRIDGFYGAPQSVGSHEFIDRGPEKVGFFLERPLQPMLASSGYFGFGNSQFEFMKALPHVSVFLGLAVDGLLQGQTEGRCGSVAMVGPPSTTPSAQPSVGLPGGHCSMAQAHLAAGATRVATTSRP